MVRNKGNDSTLSGIKIWNFVYRYAMIKLNHAKSVVIVDGNQNDLEKKANPKSLATFALVCFKEDSKKEFQLKS